LRFQQGSRFHDARFQGVGYGCWVFLPAFMMIRALKRFKIFRLLSNAFKVALGTLPVLVFSLGILVALFTGFISCVEDLSYPEALWLVIVTVFTVGYGDLAPATIAGRAALSVLMVGSCLYMAIPIGIVGTAFHEVWCDKTRLLALQDLRELLSAHGYAVEDLMALFNVITDGSIDSSISFGDFQGILDGLGCEWQTEVCKHVFDVLDIDGMGSLDIDEFLFGLFPSQRIFWQKKINKLKKSDPPKKSSVSMGPTISMGPAHSTIE